MNKFSGNNQSKHGTSRHQSFINSTLVNHTVKLEEIIKNEVIEIELLSELKTEPNSIVNLISNKSDSIEPEINLLLTEETTEIFSEITIEPELELMLKTLQKRKLTKQTKKWI
jgi:hypothetical protein